VVTKEGETKEETEKTEKDDIVTVDDVEEPKFLSDEEYYQTLDSEEMVNRIKTISKWKKTKKVMKNISNNITLL
jgi:hypothetical protein